MIRINLLPQKKGKRQRAGRPSVAGRGGARGASTGTDVGPTHFLIGMGGLAAAALAVFLLLHKPMADERDQFKATNDKIAQDNSNKQKDLKNYENLKKVVAAAKERSESIAKLVKAKAVPANLLHELGELLTPGHLPTMTQDMATKISDGPKGDPNKQFQLDWDPKHVWITSFIEKDGVFTLKGGAQSDPDVTQLAKRMQASVYFQDVTPKGGQRTADKDTQTPYYEFTITGKVVY